MPFNEYLSKISSNEMTISDLKETAKKIYDETSLTSKQKKALLEVYKQKLLSLQTEYVRKSENSLFKDLYYLIFKAPYSEVGKIIHALCKLNLFNPTERDILFSTYERRKLSKEFGVEKENAETTEKEKTDTKEIEAF